MISNTLYSIYSMRLKLALCFCITNTSINLLAQGDPTLGSSENYFQKTRIFNEPCVSQEDYKLVFFEDFLGDELDTEVWRTSYPYPAPYDRIHPSWDSLAFLDENVIIEDGFAHLLMKPQEYEYEYIDEDGHLQIKKVAYTGAVLHDLNQLPSSVHESGCWREGRFTVRAKIPSIQQSQTAFWFYGWAPEIDVYEMWSGASGPVQSNVHASTIAGIPPPNIQKTHQALDLGVPNFTSQFHDFTLEWDKYKLVWYFDGISFRTFYRYYSKEVIPELDNFTYFQPLSCEDIPRGVMMEVYEHQAWDRLPNEQYNFFLTDVILSASVHDIFDGEQQPMTEEAIWKIDYFMVEQANKECSWSLTAREPICRPNELYRISISCEEYPETADYQSITWIVSDNLTIEQICTENSCIDVRLNSTSQDPVAVVEAHIPNDDSCHDYKIKKEFPIVGNTPEVEVIGECYTGLIYPFFEIPAGHYSLSILEENLTNINWILPLDINIVGPASNGSMLLNLEEGDSFVLTLEADTPCGRQTTNFNIQVTEGCGAGDNGTIIFPNPLTDQLSITSKKEIPGIFELYDLSFNALQTFEFSSGTSFQLDLSGFESGTYFLRLVGTNELRQIAIVR